METVDAQRVLVVGNGPVGQTTALLLARWGIPVLLVDRRPARDAIGSKAICQQRDVLDVWAVCGAGEQIADEGVTWTTARTFYRDRELFGYDIADPGLAHFPPFVNISQTRTEQLLDEQIAGQPLIEVRWGCDVLGLEQDEHEVRLRCGVRSGRDGTPGDQTLRAAYVVACVGAHCDTVHDALGVGFDGTGFADRFLICDIRTDLPGWAKERRFYFDPEWNPGRQVLIHPCPDSTYRIDWQVPPDFDLAAEEADGGLDRRIRKVIGEQDYELVWHSVYRFSSRIVSRMQVGRALLAGDCAHLVAPFGARGLNAGVADAENAAWKLAFVLHGWGGGGLHGWGGGGLHRRGGGGLHGRGGGGLLASYHDERHAAARENLDVTTATMDFLVPQTDAERAHRRDVLERAGVDAEARAEVDSGRLSEPFWYAGSPLVTPAAHRPAAVRPERGAAQLPGPGVIVPDVPIRVAGRATRSRAILRDGFAFLATPGVDPSALRAARDAGADGMPVSVHELADIDPDGALAVALDVHPGELWLVRPDAHVAAVLSDPGPEPVTAAVRRALGRAPRPADRPLSRRA
ncbi:MAG TPA: FAD-dependent monooxygenase [Nocardioidaceae bacterium]|nr:FAD-dependent monooxygenase [Nocardioidaceae bacterium]